MKPINNIISRTLLILLLGILLPVKALGQCANITVTTTKEDSQCSNTGKITVTVSGQDITDGKYFGLQYRVYRPGTDPEIWVDDNSFHNLAAGTYKVDVRGKCQEQGNTYVEVENAAPAVTITQAAWYPVNIKVEKTRSAFECIDPNGGGQVRFSMATGGTGPYKLKIISKPTTYTGPTEKTFATAASINNTTWDNLTAGTYVFELSESSICHSTATATVTVSSLAIQLPNLFQYAYPARYNNMVATDDQAHKAIAVSRASLSGDYTYYLSNLNGKVEYTYYHPIDGVPNDNDPTLVWKPMPNNTSMILLDDMKYTLDETIADPNKRPVLMVRILTGSCAGTVQKMSIPTYRNPTATYTYSVVSCDKQRFALRPWTDYDGLFTWPITWAVYKKQADNSYSLVGKTDTPISYTQSSSYTYLSDYLDNGSYKYVVTTKLGTEYSGTFTLTASTPADGFSASRISLGCNYQEEIPYVSFNPKGTEKVKLLKVEKRVEGGALQIIDVNTEPGFTAPTFTEWKKSDLPANFASSSGALSFWAKNKANALVNNSNSITKDNANLVNVGTQALSYRYHFEVTDTCGIVKTRTIDSYDNYYQYVAVPKDTLTYDCYGAYDLKITNISNLIKYRRRSVSSSSVINATAYINIVAGPSGGYDANTYIWSSSQALKIRKAGTYKIRVGYTVGYTATDSCAQYFNLEVNNFDTSFRLDGNLTAAYRCQNSFVGDGYIKIAVQNGSGGPYQFELYQLDKQTNTYTSIASNTIGEFSGWAQKNSDSYKVKVTDNGCTTIRSFEQKLDVLNLSNVPISWTENYNVCPGSTIKLHALALGTTTYKWTGPNGWSSTDKDPIITNVGPEHTGIYKVRVQVPYCGGEEMVDSVTVSVGIPTLYWNPEATDGNWFNKNNWLLADGTISGGHPSPCTTVHIPGNADHYPNLSQDHSPWSLNGQPACDSIIYHYGAETTYPSHLLYSRAIIQYNWGYYDANPTSGSQPTLHKDASYPKNGTRPITSLPRGQWNMLSAPLKHIVGGDFSLGGYPNTYQRLYNIQKTTDGITPHGTTSHTKPFEKYNVDLGTTCNALAVAVVPYKANSIGSSNQSNLQAAEGIMEIPYILNPITRAHRPHHTYTDADSTSTFTYYDMATLAPITGNEAKINRGYKTHRFIYEKADDKPEKILIGSENVSIYRMPLIQPHTGKKIMIGNPLMSHIDFEKLYALNTGIISNRYEIIEATTGNTLTYEIGGTSNTTTKHIAPLQAFIVERLNPATPGEELIFHLDGTNTVVSFGTGNTALPKPKSQTAETPKSWIHIESQTKDNQVGTINKDAIRLLIGFKDIANTYKTMKTEDLAQKAEILLIGQDGKWYSDLNQKNTQGTETYILGVHTTTQETITLNITPGGELINNVQLVDKYLGTTTDVTNGGRYTFNQRIGWFMGGREGMDINRFELIVTLKK